MAKKEEELLEQLEVILKELKEGKQQGASTAIINNRGTISFGHFISMGLKKWKMKIMLFLLIFMLIGTVIGIGSFRLFSNSNDVVEKGSFIEQVKELSSLATSQAFVKAVIEKEDNEIFGKEIKANIPGTKRKLLLIIPGTVTAGVDLSNIQNDHLRIDEESKVISMTLPHAEIIQEPSLDFDRVQTFSVEGIFRQEVDWNEAYDLASEAKSLVKEEAIAQGLLEVAQQNAEKVLKQFYEQMGYDITIQYED